MIIAIDGPSGAGKSSLARKLAQHFGFIYVDTGAMYRSVGLDALESGVPTDDEEGVTFLLKHIKISIEFIDGTQHIFLNGEDVSEKIRRPEASMAASNVSAIPAVRDFLLDLQRDFGKKHNVIMDGRDIGTVVFPDAELKIFLTASAEERAKRRCAELIEKGFDVDYDTLLEEIKQRDYNDSNRAAAPLKQAPDAICIDTTGLLFEQSFELLRRTIEERM